MTHYMHMLVSRIVYHYHYDGGGDDNVLTCTRVCVWKENEKIIKNIIAEHI
jgi:hypothetical protein